MSYSGLVGWNSEHIDCDINLSSFEKLLKTYRYFQRHLIASILLCVTLTSSIIGALNDSTTIQPAFHYVTSNFQPA